MLCRKDNFTFKMLAFYRYCAWNNSKVFILERSTEATSDIPCRNW